MQGKIIDVWIRCQSFLLTNTATKKFENRAGVPKHSYSNMKSSTKAERAQIALKVLELYEGVPFTLGHWLYILNKELSSKYMIKNTKELAYMFRYMATIMQANIERVRKPLTLEQTQTYNTIYIFYGEKRGNYSKSEVQLWKIYESSDAGSQEQQCDQGKVQVLQ